MNDKCPSKKIRRAWQRAGGKWLWIAVLVFTTGRSVKVLANPTGGSVLGGNVNATITGEGTSLTTIHQTSASAFINWSGFDIQAGETTTFIQPSAKSVVFNEIGGADPSQIFGNLNANGTVILANANGFFFGPNSMIKVGGDFIATTAPITPDFGSGSSWTFTGMPPSKSIINHGSIQAGNGRSLFLIAEIIENDGDGILNAPGGNIGLVAGQTVLVSERPDGRGLSASVQVPAGSVNNLGQITADAGTIALQAQVVNQNGIIQANSVQNQNGVIELVASDQLTLGASSQINASGDGSTSGSVGGNVTLQSGNAFSDSVGSEISVTGGSLGGNGGNVEISAPNVSPLNSTVNASALKAGSTGGQFFLGLANLVLGTDATYANSPDASGTLNNINGFNTSYVNVNSAFQNITAAQILLEASGNISLDANTIWNLTASTGHRINGQLTLEAGGDIVFGNGSQITDANNWSVTLDAGYSFANHAVLAGIGNIYLNGGNGQSGIGFVQLSQGSINLTAGNSIVVGSGCQLIADGGAIGLRAQTVNQNGLIQADSVQNQLDVIGQNGVIQQDVIDQRGVIELIASDQLILGANSKITASGDNSSSGSAGGNVTLQSGNIFSDSAGSQIIAAGGTQGGNGGSIAISAPNFLSLNSSLDAGAQAGSTAGQLLLNAQDITLNASGANGVNGGTLDLNVNGTFANFSQIILQASGATATGSGNITLAAGNAWDLGAGSGQLTLDAAGDITFGSGSKITDANHWSATLVAGYNFANHAVQSGVGNIYLNGGSGQSGIGSILLSQASLNLTAGNSIVVGSGCQLIADGGTIGLHAPTVNQNGLLQANSVGNQHGIIELVASGTLTLGANSQITAAGDNSPAGSAGGNVTLQAGATLNDSIGKIIATGGSQGGNGGNVWISAPSVSSLNPSVNTSAQAGWTGGQVFLGLMNLVLGKTDGAIPDNGTVNAINGFGTTYVNVNSAFQNITAAQILLEASGNISLASSTTWDLTASTGNRTSGQLTLEAGGNIIFGSGSKITDANDWSVTLEAGYNFANQAVHSGVGNIYLNGGSGLNTVGTIQLAAGDVNLVAGQSILVAPMGSKVLSGSIFTTGGGNIFAYAMAGDIIAGTSNGGTGYGSSAQTSDYNFTGDGYVPYPDIGGILGGISTAAGGNVTLIAGNNIDSTPNVPRAQAPGASGTYGSGDVTIIAGNQITGNYNLADGVGTMIAGVPVTSSQAAILQKPGADAAAYAATLGGLVAAVQQSQNVNGNIGTPPDPAKTPSYSSSPVTLSVINGTWNAYAANDISLKEVNNPNGAFNYSQSFLFDYAPDAAANFWAGNAIELIGANLGRLTSVNKTPIYAPILSLNAGAGGILIDKSIILAPSRKGSLTIITRDGGNVSGAVVSGSTVLNGITMSDSASSDYTTFASEHDDLHPNDANPHPVYLDVSGDINSFSLTVPAFAGITVLGNTYNFGFQGRNLSPGQTTSIHVLGNITYRGDLTDIVLTPAQLADLLPTELFTDSADVSVTSKLRYDAATGELIFVGVMSAADLAFLLNPSILKLDQNGNPVTQPALDADGNPILDANGNPTTIPVTTPLVLDATQQGMINQLYTASLTASLGDQGLSLAGPGNFNISAHSMDLGVSGGIRVLAPDAALAAISPYGANLSVTTLGDLTMTSTKIANESLLGDVNVKVGGTLDVGGQFTAFGDAGAPKGIFTTSGGNVNVTANGDVNVNGSRIAAYNGGNITIESQTGNVNAGVGGSGYVNVTSLELGAAGNLTTLQFQIPGSGILATTVPGSDAALGNITVNAPDGDINASLGGILQLAFNGADTRNNFIDLNAGHDINATGSGVIGFNVNLKAGGNINGVVIGRQSVNINSQHNVDVTVVSAGNVDISASGEVSGTVVGGGNVDVSGSSITASLISESVSASGDTSGASMGIPQSNVTRENAETADDTATMASKTDDQADENKKKAKGIALAQKTGRVTIVLPPRQQPKAQTPDPRT